MATSCSTCPSRAPSRIPSSISPTRSGRRSSTCSSTSSPRPSADEAEGRGEDVDEHVTFPAGSMVLTPSMEQHLLRVADFMRKTPYVTLTMHPVVVSADLEAIKSTEVAARLQQ